MKPTGREPDRPFGRLIAHGLAREVDASGNACPDADLLAGWFDHTLSSPEVERVAGHVAGCECCQQILAALARSEPEVIRAAPLPAPPRAWHWHWRWVVPLATAVLVLVVGSRTLRAPGPVTRLRPSGYGEASPRPSGYGEASPRPSGYGEAGPRSSSSASPPPAQVVMKGADRISPPADRTARTAMANRVAPAPQPLPTPPAADAAGARPSPLGYGEAGRQPALAEAVKVEVVPPPAPPLPQGTKPESQMAEQAQRQADNASAKMLRTAAPAAVAPPPPPPAVAGQPARLTFNSMAVRQTSVTSSMLSGSAVSWRFGRDGSIEKSSDRGQTWVRQSSGVTTALTDASAPSDRICWIVGAGGVVLRTTDGVTWQQLASPTGAESRCRARLERSVGDGDRIRPVGIRDGGRRQDVEAKVGVGAVFRRRQSCNSIL